MRAIILVLSALFFMGAVANAQTSVVKAGNVVPVSERLPGHEADTYRFGIAYKSMRGTTPGQCEAACNGDQNCAAWSLVPATFQMGPRCELKRNIGAQEYRPGAVSGVATKYHPRPKTPQNAYARPAPAPAPASALRRAPAVSTPPAPRPKPVTLPKPAPKPVAPPKPNPKSVTVPAPAPKPIASPQPSPKPVTRPVAPPQQPVQVAPAPRPHPAPTRLTRPTQPVVQPQPRSSQGLEGGPVKVYRAPSPAPAPVATRPTPTPAPRPAPAPLPITRQPQPRPQPVAPKPAPQPERPKQFEMQPSAAQAPQPAPQPAPVSQPEPITIDPDVASGGVATDPPAPISQRRRVPWNQRTGNEPSYSVGDTDFVPGDEQATAGFLGGVPDEDE
ncbi:PAN domain-containing protein [Hyphomonas sp. FCG-A18]|uniref:PAN domain-containing protein n=1 Tax=Hyphomonas sp. FCG-A18 TaxID=3080019 RepID=UPI002B2D4F10|nr:PAN domain-containing protein [Hyphomonas sp. FCG-A18]